MKAREGGHVIPDVLEWHRNLEDKIVCLKLRNDESLEVPTDRQLVLTGYRPSLKLYQDMNVNLSKDNYPLYEYDGEVQRLPNDRNSEGRTYKGYSLIGAIRANDNEPNALVIPGIMDSLPKLVFNTILRTMDFTYSTSSAED